MNKIDTVVVFYGWVLHAANTTKNVLARLREASKQGTNGAVVVVATDRDAPEALSSFCVMLRDSTQTIFKTTVPSPLIRSPFARQWDRQLRDYLQELNIIAPIQFGWFGATCRRLGRH